MDYNLFNTLLNKLDNYNQIICINNNNNNNEKTQEK